MLAACCRCAAPSVLGIARPHTDDPTLPSLARDCSSEGSSSSVWRTRLTVVDLDRRRRAPAGIEAPRAADPFDPPRHVRCGADRPCEPTSTFWTPCDAARAARGPGRPATAANRLDVVDASRRLRTGSTCGRQPTTAKRLDDLNTMRPRLSSSTRTRASTFVDLSLWPRQ